MRERVGETALLIVLVFAIGAGVALETLTQRPARTAAARIEGGRFVEKAAFCPPGVGSSAEGFRLAITSTSDERVPVGIEPAVARPFQLPADRTLVYSPDEQAPLNVIGYGAPVVAGAMLSVTTPVDGAGGALCSLSASRLWHFPAGTSEIGSDQRLLVFNPFPFEAVVRVVFLTPRGKIARTTLSDIAVDSGSAEIIRVNDHILRRPLLSATVEVLRGRVIAWSALVQRGDDDVPAGLGVSLGATAPAERWYFPEGGTGPRFDEQIVVMNPTEEEASITISLARDEEAIQPQNLTEIPVPPTTSKAIDLPDKDAGPASAIVQSVNGVPVVAERRLIYDGDGKQGVTFEVGATRTASEWLVPAPAARPDLDSVVVLNPSAEDATVTVEILTRSSRLRPRDVSSVVVGAGLRKEIPVERWTAGGFASLRIVSDRAVVVERASFSDALGDVASVIGQPLPF